MYAIAVNPLHLNEISLNYCSALDYRDMNSNIACTEMQFADFPNSLANTNYILIHFYFYLYSRADGLWESYSETLFFIYNLKK